MTEENKAQTGRSAPGRVLVCNPLYLASAVLVLLGLYYVMHDERLLAADLPQLLFNFSALQLYELCLVLAAVLLARRLVERDALLLVVIENVFLFVPFILLTGAAYLGGGWLGGLAVAALGLLAMRVSILRRRFPGLRLPTRQLLLGLPALLLNLALPLVYHFHQVRFEAAGADARLLLYRWLCYLALPLLFLLVNFLARVDEWPDALPQQPWLPFLTLTTWAGISVFHVVWIAYVYDLPWAPVHYLPAVWALAWTLSHRHGDLTPMPRPAAELALLLAPAATSLLMYHHDWWPVAGWLTALNAGLYLVVWWRRRGPALYLALFSLLSLLPLLPRSWLATPVSAPAAWTGGVTVLLVAVVAVAVWLRPPLAGVAGACGLGLLVGHYAMADALPVPLMAAVAFAFLLLHSLFWDDARHPGCRWLRHLAAAGWAGWAAVLVLPAFAWQPLLVHAALAAPVAALLAVCGWRRRRRELLIAAAAAAAVALAVPLKGAITLVQWGATGPLALLLAFVCLGVGTWLAWRRRPFPAPPPLAAGAAPAAVASTEDAPHAD